MSWTGGNRGDGYIPRLAMATWLADPHVCTYSLSCQKQCEGPITSVCFAAFHNIYLSFLLFVNLWSLRKWDARSLCQWDTNSWSHLGSTDKGHGTGAETLCLNELWIPETRLLLITSPLGFLPGWRERQSRLCSLIVPNHRCLETTDREDFTHYAYCQEAPSGLCISQMVQSVDGSERWWPHWLDKGRKEGKGKSNISATSGGFKSQGVSPSVWWKVSGMTMCGCGTKNTT